MNDKLTSAVLVASMALVLAGPAAADRGDAVRTKREPRQVVTHFFRSGQGLKNLQTVIGTSQHYSIGDGDTFLELARRFDLGYNELVNANPGVDPWVPERGQSLVLPTEWILPRTDHEGLVLNIPEMRFYYYMPSPRPSGRSSMVLSYPVGLGRRDWQNPQAEFKISGKTEDPAWVVPEPIRRERRRELGRNDRLIKGGDPDNPLGSHRIELTLPAYSIHGTNKDWGIGMQVSRGCVRMYAEDIEAFFPIVEVGRKGRFVYQPVKMGMRGGRVFVEVHADIYGVVPWPWLLAQELVEEMGLERYVDRQRLEAVVEAASGIPTDVSYVNWPAEPISAPIEFDERGDPVGDYPPSPDPG